MSATGRHSAGEPDATDIADSLREASFVRLVGAATGDGLAACGVLARTLAASDRPFQVSLAAVAGDASRGTDADLTVAVGRRDPTADLAVPGIDRPASEVAAAVAEEFGEELGEELLALALAGVANEGAIADGALADQMSEAGFERRAGVGLPTADLADGLAHSTLVHGPFSGDKEAAAALLAEHGLPANAAALDADERRQLASLVALATVGDDAVPPRGGEAVERALRPVAGGPARTVEGYADLLTAVAREQPGIGVALAIGQAVRDEAFAAWRDHASRAHETLRTTDSGRYDGLSVLRTDAAPVGTVARLAHAYRSPEPVTVVATDGRAAVVADHPLAEPVRTAAASVDGTGEATGTVGRARFDGTATEFITAFREAAP